MTFKQPEVIKDLKLPLRMSVPPKE